MAVKVHQRPMNKEIHKRALALGHTELQARILAGRIRDNECDLNAIYSPDMRYVKHPIGLIDARKGVERIGKAMANNDTVCFLTDYDVDGVTSHSVLKRAFVDFFKYPEEKIISVIGHRIHDGYGVTESLVKRILEMPNKPAIIITADCGSSDESRIKILKENGIDVIVTDHHAVPVEGHPVSSYATINPNRVDCPYPEKRIAGCAVAFLVMCLLRSYLNSNTFKKNNGKAWPHKIDSIAPLLSYVALGTIADCVSMGEAVANRTFVTDGLALINQGIYPCWRVLEQLIGEDSKPYGSDTLGFQIGPRINARSRLADPYAALHYLIADTEEESLKYLLMLDEDNKARKAIEKKMTDTAKALASEQNKKGYPILVVYLDEGHSGVQGIVASRLVEAYGKPIFVLTPAAREEWVSGSGRGIEGINLRNILQAVSDRKEGLLPRFGGHSGAAGVTVLREGLDDFIELIVEETKKEVGDRELMPTVLTDGEVGVQGITRAVLKEIEALGPYGREFDSPTFQGNFRINEIRKIGADQNHLLMSVSYYKTTLKAIWFNCTGEDEPLPFEAQERAQMVFRISTNRYRGKETLQLMISHAEKIR